MGVDSEESTRNVCKCIGPVVKMSGFLKFFFVLEQPMEVLILVRGIQEAPWWSNHKTDDIHLLELSVGVLDVEIGIDLESTPEFPSSNHGSKEIQIMILEVPNFKTR